MAEFYNKHRRHKPHIKRAGRYKPRAMRKSAAFTRVLIILVLVVAAIFGLLLLLPHISGGRIDIFAKSEPTPEPTKAPDVTPHPIENADMNDVVRSINISDSAFQWFTGCASYEDTLMFTGGEVVNGDAYMTALFQVSSGENANTTAQRINIVLKNDHIMSPVFNNDWLVYLDAKASGGGEILCCKYGSDYTSPTVVKEVYTGHPVLFLSGNYLAWTERTGTSMDKLFLCDLRTFETATVQTFNKTFYGVSKPHLANGKLVWADVDTENTSRITSQISILDIESGEFLTYKPDTYVHDPKSNGDKVLGWMSGNHGLDSDLFVSYDMSEPICVEKGVVDFYMDSEYVVYQKDNNIYVYILSTQEKYMLNRKGQAVQLNGAQNGCVFWSDVSSHEREIPEFAVIPH